MKIAIWKYEDLSNIQAEFPDKRVVLVGGCFDILHYGHIMFLQEAQARGDILIVALESDEFIQETKQRTPVHTQAERAIILTSMRWVDGVILLPHFANKKEYGKLVELVKPQVIAVTEGDPVLENKQMIAQKVGATVEIVTPLLSQFSTTKIRS
ncbi:MAG: adenylyltransferase/cytidyltransferase family protein [Weeksellaceae bacterium]